MTTIDTHATGTAGLSGDGGAVAVESGATVSTDGFVAWITTTDHKRIGRLFLGVSAMGALGVAVLGVLLGLDRIAADRSILGTAVVAQLFAGFRVALVPPAR